MSSSPTVPLSIAVIHCRLHGYPVDCLRSLTASAPFGCEFLLVCGADLPTEALTKELPALRVLRTRGDRAEAKNLAVREAHGEAVLLTTSDTIAQPGAVPVLLASLENSAGRELVLSAQILQENGMRRRTVFAIPSPRRELDPRIAARHLYARIRKGVPPPVGRPYPAPALHATFLMARRATFNRVGAFREGFRFACEDLNWCGRATRLGAQLFIHPEARVFKLAPQLSGPLPPEIRVALESEIWRLAASLGGGGALRTIRRCKSLIKWLGSVAAHNLLGRRSRFLANAGEAHRRIALMRLRNAPMDLSDDVESTSRWEMVF